MKHMKIIMKYVLFIITIYQSPALITTDYNHKTHTLPPKIQYDSITLYNEPNTKSCAISNQTLVESLPKSEVPFSSKTTFLNSTHWELECGTNYVQRLLSNEEFFIDSSGELYDKVRNISYKSTHYCLKQRLAQNFSYELPYRPTIEAKVCQETVPVSINRCSFEKQNNAEYCCNEEDNFSPHILLQDNIGENIYIFSGIPYDMKCPEGTSIKRTSIEDSSMIYVVSNNIVRVVVDEKNSSSNYCVEKDATNETYSLYFCANDLVQGNDALSKCQGGSCIRKCCPKGYLYDYYQTKCDVVQQNPEWKPTFFNQRFEQLMTPPNNASFVYGFPLCDNLLHLQSSEDFEQRFYILENGELYVPEYDETYGSDYFCTDYFKYDEITEESLLCFPEEKSVDNADCRVVNTSLKPALMLISCVFLTITIIVYVMLKELHGKINGKCVMSSIAALLLAYISLITMEWSSGSITMTACQSLGLIAHFFSLASFFWLNVMCFDVWRTLRSQQCVADITSYRTNRRFLKYSVYAWGLPLFITLVTACMQFLIAIPNDGIITPGFGTMGCFFPTNDPRPSWIYFYGFICIIMIVNLAFFIHLLIILQRQKHLNDAALQMRNKRQMVWLKIYLKLFCVMGVSWIFEIASWIGGSCKLWIFTDSLNSLRGVFIFFIFICKKNILQQLRKKFMPISERKTWKQKHSSSSHSRSSSNMKTSQFYVDLHENE